MEKGGGEGGVEGGCRRGVQEGVQKGVNHTFSSFIPCSQQFKLKSFSMSFPSSKFTIFLTLFMM